MEIVIYYMLVFRCVHLFPIKIMKPVNTNFSLLIVNKIIIFLNSLSLFLLLFKYLIFNKQRNEIFFCKAVREMEFDQTTTHVENNHTEESLVNNFGWPNEAFDSASGDEDSIGLIPMPGAASAKSMPNLSSTSTSTPGNSINTGGPYITDPTERRNNALLILKLLCETTILQPHIKELLTGK